jgi:hypothetical protein
LSMILGTGEGWGGLFGKNFVLFLGGCIFCGGGWDVWAAYNEE